MYAVTMQAKMDVAALHDAVLSLKDFHAHFKMYIFK